MQLKDKALELMVRVEKAIPETTPDEPKAVKLTDWPLFRTFSRLVSLHRSIRLLLVGWQVEEALILWRSLLEDAVTLRYILRRGDARTAYAIRLWQDELNDRRVLLHQPGGEELEANEVRRLLAEDEARVRSLRERFRINKLPKVPETKDAVRKLGWERDEFWMYCFGHKLVHGSGVAHMMRERVIDGVVTLSSRSDGPQGERQVAACANLSCHILLHAARDVANVLDYGSSSDYDALIKESDAFDLEFRPA